MLSSGPTQQRLTRRALALVLAGGRGSRLKQLTDRRAKPAVFFGGKFRIIDFALSNCLNSGVRRICVLTQYKAHSLLRHLQMGWSFLRPEMNEFLDLLPASSGSTRRPGIAAPPMRSTRTSISSSRLAPNTSLFWPATIFTRWITQTCWRTTPPKAPIALLPASKCRSKKLQALGSWRSTTQ